VFELVVPALIDGGLEETCLVLVAFLMVALVAPSADAPMPITVDQQMGVAGYVIGKPPIVTTSRIYCTTT
jgi:hypothetical protein